MCVPTRNTHNQFLPAKSDVWGVRGCKGVGRLTLPRCFKVLGVRILGTMIFTHAQHIKVSVCYTAPNTHTGDEIHVNESSNVRSHVMFLVRFPDSHALKKSMFLCD